MEGDPSTWSSTWLIAVVSVDKTWWWWCVIIKMVVVVVMTMVVVVMVVVVMVMVVKVEVMVMVVGGSGNGGEGESETRKSKSCKSHGMTPKWRLAPSKVPYPIIILMPFSANRLTRLAAKQYSSVCGAKSKAPS